MELFSIVGQFLLLWGFLYIIVFALQIISTRKKEPVKRNHTNSLLPTFAFVNENSSSDIPIEKDQWSIKLFQIKYTTQRLNSFFKNLTKLAPAFWKVWFTLGVITASVLMVVGMVVIVFAGFKILSSLNHAIFPSNTGNSHSKRGLDNQEDDQVFLPMVCGTTPVFYIEILNISGKNI
jgi:S2P endopeptidase